MTNESYEDVAQAIINEEYRQAWERANQPNEEQYE